VLAVEVQPVDGPGDLAEIGALVVDGRRPELLDPAVVAVLLPLQLGNPGRRDVVGPGDQQRLVLARGLVGVGVEVAVDRHDGLVVAVEARPETGPQAAAVRTVEQALIGEVVEILDRELAVVGVVPAPQLGEAQRDLLEIGVQGRLAGDDADQLVGAVPALHALHGALEGLQLHVRPLGLVRDQPGAVGALQVALGADVDLDDVHVGGRSHGVFSRSLSPGPGSDGRRPQDADQRSLTLL
jgi:hypothetical protein